jgi:hypothetical protein
VRLERLLRLRRSDRTVSLVINIPEPPPPTIVVPSPPVPPAPPSRGARIWSVVRDVGGLLLAGGTVAALVVSVAALNAERSADKDQHQADQATAAQQQRQQAEQVSFQDVFPQSAPDGAIEVVNSSHSPISNVTFDIVVSSLATGVRTYSFYLGSVPYCSDGVINIGPAVRQALENAHPKVPHPDLAIYFATSMNFTDRNGASWSELGGSFLQPLGTAQMIRSMLAMMEGGNTLPDPKYKVAAGCS